MARNPIVFSNGVLRQKAQVEIDGTTYEVEPAQYDGTTPLSAGNLNQLQTNLYNYIDDSINDFSNNVYVKGNFAELTNSITIDTKTTNFISFTLPDGFTRDNCYVIGYKWSMYNGSTYYIDNQITPNQMSNGSNCNPQISFWSNNTIRAYIENGVAASRTYVIKLLVMKIS